MRLKRLELQGFKSFLDRTILSFDSSITGVVGPNGCGKSNIVDAILWVMGEQSPKHLRGDSMTDVIFNGSDTKAPTSMAEVSLILDKQGIALAPQFAAFEKGDEISVTRRIYRDGTGEFLINKVNCRLRDIHELFMDTGVGRRAYSIIEQGQIDRMINVKPEERRHLFEEVAGITKYKTKRKEAEKKLEQTRQNLLRVHDIIAELDKQIRSLKIQATRARKYRELKTELETVDLFILGKSLHTHKKTIDEKTSEREGMVTERSELDAQFSKSDAEITQLEIQRIEQERDFQAWMTKERDLSLQLQKLEGKIQLLDEQNRFLTEAVQNNTDDRTELLTKFEGIQTEIESLKNELETVGQALQSLETELQNKEEALQSLQQKRVDLMDQRSQMQAQQSKLQQRGITLENQISHGELRITEQQSKQETLNSRLTQIVVLLDQQKASVTDVESKIDQCRRRAQEAETEASTMHSEVQLTSERLSGIEQSLFQARESFHAQRSRLDSLKELQENLEGYSPTAREILLKLGEEKRTATPLAEVIQPSADFEDTLEILLGTEMNTLLVSEPSEARHLTELIEQNGLERVRVLALTEISQDGFSGSIPTRDMALPLLESIRVNLGYEVVAERLLGGVFVVADIEQIFSLRTQYPHLTFITKGSKIFSHGDRTLSGGILPSRSGVFARRREIEELVVACGQLEAQVNDLTSQREACLALLQSQERQHEEIKDRLSQIHIESVEFRKEKEKAVLACERTEKDFVELTDESQRNVAQIETLQNQLHEFKNSLDENRREGEALIVELANADEALLSLEAEVSAIGQGIGEQRVERSRLKEKHFGMESQLQGRTHDAEELEDRIETLARQIEKDTAQVENLAGEKTAVLAQIESSQTARNEAMVSMNDAKQKFNDTCHTLTVLKEQVSEIQKRRDTLLEELQTTELKLAEERSALERLQGLSEERYQKQITPLDESATLSLEALPLLQSQNELDWASLSEKDQRVLLEEHLKTMREKVSRYGEVNLTAIHEFDEVEKRHAFLAEQRADLENSIKILEEAIIKIDESTKTRFTETFEAVNSKFVEIFPILFSGGKAELSLTNPENALEGGVDILAQPPGKRLQSITLLSGGEKALTAVSLVLSIFARKPSPFCLLDEVDAPLDDANVSRFNTVVRKMAEKTQFIVITHNKKTMEIAESLYGVTMERAGISKMTSVRLN